MSTFATNTMHNPAMLRQAGLEALTKALGPVGMIRFIRQFEQGSGDYTAEREKLLAGITMEDFEAFREKNREQSAE